MSAAFDWEGQNSHRRAVARGTLPIRKKAEADLPRNRDADLPPAERHRRKLNRVYRTLRLAAKAKGKTFPTYMQWLSAQPQFDPASANVARR